MPWSNLQGHAARHISIFPLVHVCVIQSEARHQQCANPAWVSGPDACHVRRSCPIRRTVWNIRGPGVCWNSPSLFESCANKWVFYDCHLFWSDWKIHAYVHVSELNSSSSCSGLVLELWKGYYSSLQYPKTSFNNHHINCGSLMSCVVLRISTVWEQNKWFWCKKPPVFLLIVD